MEVLGLKGELGVQNSMASFGLLTFVFGMRKSKRGTFEEFNELIEYSIRDAGVGPKSG